MPGTGDIDKLRKRLNGDLLLPSTPAYDLARRVFNGRVDRRPALIARCRGTGDVRECVLFAREHGLPVTTKAGGHGPTGFAVRDGGLLIDLSLMRGVWVDPSRRTAIVQGGAQWKDVYREAALYSLVPSGGDCDMVGVAGSTLGGGWGYLSRSLGLAIDSLHAARLVTADGQLATASRAENPELYWALRGAGGGNFGVATGFEFHLHRLPAEVYAGEIVWPYDKAADVLAAYRDHVLSGPPHNLYADFNLYDDDSGTKVASISCVYVGLETGGRAALQRFFDVPGWKDNSLQSKPYLSVLEEYAAEIVPGKLELWKSGFLVPTISSATIGTIVDRFRRPPMPSSPLLFIETLGGVIQHVKPEETAYPHRHELMCLTLIGSWERQDLTAAMDDWVRQFRRALEPGMSGSVYVNYPDADLVDWPTAYYGANYRRLKEVKRQYDPDNVFRFAQSIEI